MSRPFIIAEVGSNFDQSLNKAKKYIETAKKCGADAVKFQLFSGENLYPKNPKMQKIFKSIELDLDWIDILLKHANKKKIGLFFSCFDKFKQDLLIKKGVLMHKIASSEVENFHIFKNLNKKKFKVFISSGMSDLDDLKNIYKKVNKSQTVIMQCTSLYPTNLEDVNLNVLKSLKRNFKSAELGFSDHTISDVSAITAVGLGAKYFEKHITLNKKLKGPDHFYAYEPKEFKKYVDNIHSAYKCLGTNQKTIDKRVRKVARLKGVYSKNYLKKNEVLTKKKIFIDAPALGLRKKELRLVLGKKLKKDVKKNKPLKLEFFK